MTELILKDETYAITGAAIEVHRALGPGFLEKVYQEAMQLELSARKIPYEVEKRIDIRYRGQYLTQKYYADLICYGQIIVEIKAINQLSGREDAQILNYLKATGLKSRPPLQLRQPRQTRAQTIRQRKPLTPNPKSAKDPRPPQKERR